MNANQLQELKQLFLCERLIVIARDVPARSLLPLGEALYFAGVRFLELPFPDAKSSEENRKHTEKIAILAKAFRGRMQIGGGTVLNEEQVALTASAGGTFVLSPDADERVVRKAKDTGLLSIPAGLTPAEIRRAYDLGADFVKLFPASAMGPAYIKAILGPFSQIPIIAMGGVALENIADYAASGAVGFGIGSGIVDRALLEKGDFDGIFHLAKAYVEQIKKVYRA